ncbi:MAG: UMP kinase [Euryarchaeota archaeon]|nr:UMP kinase [Euryarchaeota archaeon]
MVVISLGGSIVSRNGVDIDYVKKFRNFMRTCHVPLYVVVGGGELARNYINYARTLQMNEYTLDEIGIMATRLNAKLLITEDTYPEIPETISEAIFAGRTYKNVVMGGTEPGHTTDGVSLLLAEKLGEKKVINMTSVGGIYDRDPRKFSDAKLVPQMSYDEAKSLFFSEKMDAGLNIPLDLLAIKIAERSNIALYIVSKDLENVRKVINDEDFEGTVIGKFDA